MAKKKATTAILPTTDHSGLLGDVVSLLEAARRMSARAVNAVMTATYWGLGGELSKSSRVGSSVLAMATN